LQPEESGIITESDILLPSEDFPLSPELWPFKALYVGHKVPPPTLSDEQLNSLGFSSWKGMPLLK
jgi:hypothetical protein